MLTARNILAGERLYDIWQVNEDAEYHEAGAANAGILAASILAGTDDALLKRLDAFRKAQTDAVAETVEDVK